jgi:hypothetical protein
MGVRAILETVATLHEFAAGGYAFLEGGYPYSQGVVARPGHALVRVRFAHGLSIAQGFARIEAHLRAAGRPTTALAACELRSPAPFTFDGFGEFNAGYRAVLERWGLVRGGLNPVARSNLAPAYDPPGEPVFHAFTYTVADADAPAAAPDWLVAGSGEWPESTPFPQGIVARGDTSPAGLARKADYVLDTMHQRCAGLGVHLRDATVVQVYTVHDIHPLLAPAFASRGLLGAGLTWFACRPPIRELEFEMDVRRVRREVVLDP